MNEVLTKTEIEPTLIRSILFVCLGNICRSPTAEAVFAQKAIGQGRSDLRIDSAGTGAWHVGNPPDQRATHHAKLRGYDLSPLRARAVDPTDFEHFDLILAMDQQNFVDLVRAAPKNSKAKIELFLNYEQSTTTDVPDPYYGGDQGFENVLDLIEAASDGLLKTLKES